MEQLQASLLKEDAHQISESRFKADRSPGQCPIIVSDRQLQIISIKPVFTTYSPSTRIQRLDCCYPTSSPVQDARWAAPNFWTTNHCVDNGADEQLHFGPVVRKTGHLDLHQFVAAIKPIRYSHVDQTVRYVIDRS